MTAAHDDSRPLNKKELNQIPIFKVFEDDLKDEPVDPEESATNKNKCTSKVVCKTTDFLDYLDTCKPKRVTESLRKYKACNICFMEFEVGNSVRSMPVCNHVFHVACIDQWLLNEKGTCPVDRRTVRV